MEKWPNYFKWLKEQIDYETFYFVITGLAGVALIIAIVTGLYELAGGK